MERLKGSCNCGAVTFSAVPSSAKIGACHCATCRKMGAGPFFGVECGETLAVDTDADLGIYDSSDWAERGFCRKCGSSLFWRLKDHSMTIIGVDLFDDAPAFEFDHEVYIDKKPDYYSFAQTTHQMTEQDVMTAFAEGKST